MYFSLSFRVGSEWREKVLNEILKYNWNLLRPMENLINAAYSIAYKCVAKFEMR